MKKRILGVIRIAVFGTAGPVGAEEPSHQPPPQLKETANQLKSRLTNP